MLCFINTATARRIDVTTSEAPLCMTDFCESRLCEGATYVVYEDAYGSCAGNALWSKPSGMQTGNEPGLYLVQAKAQLHSTGRHAAH